MKTLFLLPLALMEGAIDKSDVFVLFIGLTLVITFWALVILGDMSELRHELREKDDPK